MGVVWRARDQVLGEEVALKFLPDAVRWDPGAYEDLKGETRRARQLTHPNIVRIHDFVEDSGSAAISMELVEGATLTALRLTRPAKVFSPDEIAAWLPQLCAALDYAHGEARVVHRDLKPANLMLTGDGRLKVADFGVARSMADSITRVSMMSAGTLVYMSPQQAMGEEPSPADDLYALGATLYELLTGKPPFHTGDVRLQLFQRRPDSIAARRKSLGLAGGDIPPAWESALAACLAKEPSERPTTAGELIRRLNGAGQKPRRWWRLPTRREVGLGAVGLALAAAAGLTFSSLLRSVGAAPVGGFPSDATRALAAWNFDGDARDASGQGHHAVICRAVATADRFGRIDRALKFNGNAEVIIPDAPALRWSGADPFTAALWVRQDESPTLSGEVLRYGGSRVNSLGWGMGFNEGRPVATLSRYHQEGYCSVFGADLLAPGTWHHLAITSDGTVLTLFVDGRVVGANPIGALRLAAAPEKVELRFGRPVSISGWSLDGALDEARVWRRALSAQEIARLGGDEAPPRLVPTRGAYHETDDIADALRAEFGDEARLLDWSELKRLHADDARGWADEMRFAVNGTNGWLQRDGRRVFEDKRYYFVGRFDGVKPDYYKVHDEVGGLTLALGSWYGSRVPLLVRLPPAKIETEVLVVGGTDRMIHLGGGLGANRAAVGLTWQARLTPTIGGSLTARLRLANGREVRAVCATEAEASIALALGAAEGGGIARNIGASFGEFEFTLVARDRHLSFRAVSAVGRNPLFIEAAVVEDFRLADVVAIEVAGGPQSGLASATLVKE